MNERKTNKKKKMAAAERLHELDSQLMIR